MLMEHANVEAHRKQHPVIWTRDQEQHTRPTYWHGSTLTRAYSIDESYCLSTQEVPCLCSMDLRWHHTIWGEITSSNSQ